MVETKRDIFSEKPCAVIWNPNLVGLMEWMRPAWRAVYVNSDRWSLMVCTNKLLRLQSRGDLEKMQSICLQIALIMRKSRTCRHMASKI